MAVKQGEMGILLHDHWYDCLLGAEAPTTLLPRPTVGDHTTPINPKAKMFNRTLFLLHFVGILPAYTPINLW